MSSRAWNIQSYQRPRGVDRTPLFTRAIWIALAVSSTVVLLGQPAPASGGISGKCLCRSSQDPVAQPARRVGGIVLEGVTLFEKDELIRTAGIKVDAMIDRASTERAKEAILRAYFSQGHVSAIVTIAMSDPDDGNTCELYPKNWTGQQGVKWPPTPYGREGMKRQRLGLCPFGKMA
ncbi:MAG TPA: POTRA domain-containing protein [Blastocatellia bacterium]|nr:POTRA domain-containing protein [Blastocatellia bacterium]